MKRTLNFQCSIFNVQQDLAVIGIDLDYETLGSNGSMLMVTACGTAVVVD